MSSRIAVVYDSLFPINLGGGERVYRRICEELVRRGHDVEYVTRRQWIDVAPEAEFRIVGLRSRKIYDDRGVRTVLGALSFGLKVFIRLLRRRRDLDIVIASALPVLTVLAARLALIGSPTRVIADWLEVWPWRKWREYSGPVSGTIAFVLQGIAARAVEEHTVNSVFTATRLREIAPRSHPVVLGLIDLADAKEPVDASTPPYVLFVGRLIDDKKPLDAISAVHAARATVTDLRLVVVGDGPLRGAVTSARDSGADFVEVRGRITDEDLVELRAGAVALIVTSVREGFGLVVAESASAGVPVAIAPHPDDAAVELVDDGINGFVGYSSDPQDMARAIVAIVERGRMLRVSTFEWFGRQREERGIARSLDRLLTHPSQRDDIGG